MNKHHKQKELKLFLKENNVSIIAMLEHKIKKNLASRLIQKVAPQWKYESYAFSDKRRIWILWDTQHVKCEVANKTSRFIHTRVKIKRVGM